MYSRCNHMVEDLTASTCEMTQSTHRITDIRRTCTTCRTGRLFRAFGINLFDALFATLLRSGFCKPVLLERWMIFCKTSALHFSRRNPRFWPAFVCIFSPDYFYIGDFYATSFWDIFCRCRHFCGGLLATFVCAFLFTFIQSVLLYTCSSIRDAFDRRGKLLDGDQRVAFAPFVLFMPFTWQALFVQVPFCCNYLPTGVFSTNSSGDDFCPWPFVGTFPMALLGRHAFTGDTFGQTFDHFSTGRTAFERSFWSVLLMHAFCDPAFDPIHLFHGLLIDGPTFARPAFNRQLLKNFYNFYNFS